MNYWYWCISNDTSYYRYAKDVYHYGMPETSYCNELPSDVVFFNPPISMGTFFNPQLISFLLVFPSMHKKHSIQNMIWYITFNSYFQMTCVHMLSCHNLWLVSNVFIKFLTIENCSQAEMSSFFNCQVIDIAFLWCAITHMIQ